MTKLPDTIYLIDPYDEDGNLLENTEDVCWCADAAGDVNVKFLSAQSVAAALAALWHEMDDSMGELRETDHWVERLESAIAALGLPPPLETISVVEWRAITEPLTSRARRWRN